MNATIALAANEAKAAPGSWHTIPLPSSCGDDLLVHWTDEGGFGFRFDSEEGCENEGWALDDDLIAEVKRLLLVVE